MMVPGELHTYSFRMMCWLCIDGTERAKMFFNENTTRQLVISCELETCVRDTTVVPNKVHEIIMIEEHE